MSEETPHITSNKPTSGEGPASRLYALLELKDFAIARGMPITDETIRSIGELEDTHQTSPTSWSKDDIFKLDTLIRAVSETTYPITIENIDNVRKSDGRSYRWVYRFLWVGVGFALMSGLMMAMIKSNSFVSALWEVMASISLGVVGAVIYVMLPNGKINTVAGLDTETIMTNVSRIVTGGLLGYVIYLIVPNLFDILKDPNKPSKDALGLLYPLIGGYSISLVVGILSKAVTALELTLGLDEKKNRNSLRK
jgi:hypothetical protein